MEERCSGYGLGQTIKRLNGAASSPGLALSGGESSGHSRGRAGRVSAPVPTSSDVPGSSTGADHCRVKETGLPLRLGVLMTKCWWGFGVHLERRVYVSLQRHVPGRECGCVPLSVQTCPGKPAGACLYAECAHGRPGWWMAVCWGNRCTRGCIRAPGRAEVLLQHDKALPDDALNSCRSYFTATSGGQGFPEPDLRPSHPPCGHNCAPWEL